MTLENRQSTATAISDPEQFVRDHSIDWFRQLLPIVAPQICGYEMRALPTLVLEGAERLKSSRDHFKDLYEKRRDAATVAEDRVAALTGTLGTLQAELRNFAYYSRSVAEEAAGQRREIWEDRAEWADKLADQASKALR